MRSVLEVGCGSGYVICSAALALAAAAPAACASFAAVDINPAALAATAATLAAHGVAGVDLIQCDLLTPLARRLAGAVDLLVSGKKSGRLGPIAQRALPCMRRSPLPCIRKLPHPQIYPQPGLALTPHTHHPPPFFARNNPSPQRFNPPYPSPHIDHPPPCFTFALCTPPQLFNPPYVPTPAEEVSRNGIARAWAGGDRGRVVIDRLLPQLPALLAPGGSCLMVTVQENDPDGALP